MVKVKRKNKRDARPIHISVEGVKLYNRGYSPIINLIRDSDGFVQGWHPKEFNLKYYIENKDKTYTFNPY